MLVQDLIVKKGREKIVKEEMNVGSRYEKGREKENMDSERVILCYAMGIICYTMGILCYAMGIICYARGIICHARGIMICENES